MLNLKFIQENPEVVIAKLKKKYFDASEIVGQITGLSVKKNEIQAFRRDFSPPDCLPECDLQEPNRKEGWASESAN